MSLIWLAEVTAATTAGSAATTTLRYASGTGYNHPSAPGYYEGRILQPANLSRTMFSSGTTAGAVQVGYGELRLANIDGGLDSLVGYGFAGRPFKLLIGDSAAPYASFVAVLVGTMEQAGFSIDEVTIRLRDKLAVLEARPASPGKYGGTNALPAGVDGTADDIKGNNKPRVWGRVLNITPATVNSSRLIYQVSDSAVSAIPAVYDNGVLLTAGTAYTSQADMEATAPAAANYRAWPAGGMFRLGSSPAGQITADVTEGANRTAGQLLSAMAQGPGGLGAGEVSAADAAALDAAAPDELGLFVTGDESTRSAMEQIANAAGAWFGFDRLGVLRMGRLTAPAGTPAVTLKRLGVGAVAEADSVDILGIERLPSDDVGRGVPAWSVTVRHSRNWTVQSSVAGSVTAARRAFLGDEWRASSSTASAVLLQHPLAPDLTFESLLLSDTAAAAEAARRLALYSVRRDSLRVTVRLDEVLVGAVDLGAVVRVLLPRFGYDLGRLMIVIGMEYDAAGNVADLELWG